MYQLTSEEKELFKYRPNHLEISVGETTIDNGDLIENSFICNRYASSTSEMEIGSAIAAEVSFSLNNYYGKFDNVNFEGVEMLVQVYVLDDDNNKHYCKLGYFTCDDAPRKKTIIEVSALDRMTRFDVISTASGTTTLKALLTAICNTCEVPLATTSFPNESTVIELPTDKTSMRQLVAWIAQTAGMNAVINRDGALELKWYGGEREDLLAKDRFSSDIAENTISITGISCEVDGVEYLAGTSDYVVSVNGNSFITKYNVATILNNVYHAVQINYYPFSAETLPMPWIDPMDAIYLAEGYLYLTDESGNRLTDEEGNNLIVLASMGQYGFGAVTDVTYALNQSTALKSEGISKTEKDRVSPDYLPPSMVESIAPKIGQNLSQELVFDRLTNGGQNQGIYLVEEPTGEKKIYLNFEFAKGQTLVLGGLDDTNGTLEVRNASNEIIGLYDHTGSNIYKGQIRSYDDGGNYSELTNGHIGFYNASGQWYGKLNRYFDSQITRLEIEGSKQLSIRTNAQTASTGLLIESPSSDSNGFIMISGDKYISIGPNQLTGIIYINSPNTEVSGNLVVKGTKPRIVDTRDYGIRTLYAYETSDPTFGDIGEAVIGEDGLIYVDIDPVLAQTISTKQYQVFLQKYGNGDLWIKERHEAYFVVEGTPNLKFAWELKARQSDFDQLHIEEYDPHILNNWGMYNVDDAQHTHIDELEEEYLKGGQDEEGNGDNAF